VYFILKGKVGLSLSDKKVNCFRKLKAGSYFGDAVFVEQRSRLYFM
jgi:hypothetical protein